MKHMYKAFYGALLVLGLAGIIPEPAQAQGGYVWDSVCNCRRPDSQYNTRRVVRDATPRVVTRQRIVDHTRVVRGNTRLIQENRLIVHVRPVINRTVPGTVRRIVERREVRGVNCNCGYDGGYRTSYRGGGDVVSYRD